jgi:hypothetical protein
MHISELRKAPVCARRAAQTTYRTPRSAQALRRHSTADLSSAAPSFRRFPVEELDDKEEEVATLAMLVLASLGASGLIQRVSALPNASGSELLLRPGGGEMPRDIATGFTWASCGNFSASPGVSIFGVGIVLSTLS